MRLKLFAIFFAVSSLTSCVSGPRLSYCVLGVAEHACYCAPLEGGDAVGFPLEHCDGYTALSPDDTQILVEWIKRHTSKKGE